MTSDCSRIALSIIIPVYNAEKHILRCLKSLERQTLKQIEIICIDDGYTDNSTDIIQQFTRDDDRFKLIQQENAGAGAARKKGIRTATGEYIGFVDSDDYVDSEYFEKLYTSAVTNKADVVATSDSWLAYEDGHVEKCPMFPFDAKINLSKKERFEIFCLSGVIWNKIYKKDFLFSILDYYIETNLSCEDVSLTIAACLLSPIFSTITDAKYFYLQTLSSYTRNKKTVQDVKNYYSFYTELQSFFAHIDNDPHFFHALKKRRTLDTFYCLQHLTIGQQLFAIGHLLDMNVFVVWLCHLLKTPCICAKKFFSQIASRNIHEN